MEITWHLAFAINLFRREASNLCFRKTALLFSIIPSFCFALIKSLKTENLNKQLFSHSQWQKNGD